MILAGTICDGRRLLNSRVRRSSQLALVLALLVPVLQAEPYVQWEMKNYAVDGSLAGLKGDPRRGRKIAIARGKGNCLACHRLPIPEEEFHGTVGPPLYDIGARLTEGQIRLRIIDEKQVNPMTIMPGFYRDPRHFYRVLDEYEGKTILTPQEVEDVVAYLRTLREMQK